jgi:hypothetical protein
MVINESSKYISSKMRLYLGGLTFFLLIFLVGVFTNEFLNKYFYKYPSWLVTSYLTKSDLPVVYVDIAFENLTTLEENRIEALKKGYLSPDEKEYVPIKFTYKGKTIKGKARLKGDYNLHHDDPLKYSVRIKLDEHHTELNLSKFSLQHPKVRAFHVEKMLYDFARNHGVIAPRYDYVKVVRNGESIGIMAIEEVYTSDTIDSNRRREGLFIKFDDDLINKSTANVYRYYDFRTANVRAMDEKRILRKPFLKKQYSEAKGLLEQWSRGEVLPSEIFDITKTGKYFAIVELFNAKHGLDFTNMFFYFDPMTKLLEPVIYDAEPLSGVGYGRPIINYNFAKDILSDDLIFNAYLLNLEEIGNKLIYEIDDWMIEYEQRMGKEFKREFFDHIPYSFTQLKGRAEKFSKYVGTGQKNYEIYANSWLSRIEDLNLDNDRAIYRALLKVSLYEKDSSLYIDFYNITNKDVEVLDVIAFGPNKQTNLLDRAVKLTPLKKGLPPENIIKIKIPTKEHPIGNDIIVKTVSKIIDANWKEVQQTDFIEQRYRSLTTSPKVSELLDKYPFMSYDIYEGVLSIEPGTWTIDDKLLLPENVGLTITAGTKLLFSSQSGIVSSGPLKFLGTEKKPIFLTALNDNWQGIYVKRSRNKSEFNNVNISNIKRDFDTDYFLTGCITFLGSDIDIFESKIEKCLSEDSLNLVNSIFNISFTAFNESLSDAIDLDYSSGTINNVQISTSGGDGLDLSNSKVFFNNGFFSNIIDKAISVGENSLLTGENIQIYQASVGVASKDGSLTNLNNIQFENISFSPLMVYNKKKNYGPGSINANGAIYQSNVNKPLRQIGSFLNVNGELISEVPLDVKDLYENSFMSKIKNF